MMGRTKMTCKISVVLLKNNFIRIYEVAISC